MCEDAFEEAMAAVSLQCRYSDDIQGMFQAGYRKMIVIVEGATGRRVEEEL